MYIKIEANADGSHAVQYGGTLESGWAVWPENISIPPEFPYVDIETEIVTHKATDQEQETWTEVISATGRKDPGVSIGEMKAAKIAQSKTKLAEYLSAHPLAWTDGKRYSVTEEKQALLMGNIAAYQIEVQNNPEAVVTWNATGEECVPWNINELCALAVAIKNYVKPLVSHQQAMEVAVNNCETAEDVEEIAIDYTTVYSNA